MYSLRRSQTRCSGTSAARPARLQGPALAPSWTGHACNETSPPLLQHTCCPTFWPHIPVLTRIVQAQACNRNRAPSAVTHLLPGLLAAQPSVDVFVAGADEEPGGGLARELGQGTCMGDAVKWGGHALVRVCVCGMDGCGAAAGELGQFVCTRSKRARVLSSNNVCPAMFKVLKGLREWDTAICETK